MKNGRVYEFSFEMQKMFLDNYFRLECEFPGEYSVQVLFRHGLNMNDMYDGPIMEKIRQSRIDKVMGE